MVLIQLSHLWSPQSWYRSLIGRGPSSTPLNLQKALVSMWVISLLFKDNFCSVYGSCNGQTYVWVAIKFFWKGTFISKAQRMLDNCYRLKFNLKQVCCCVGERGKVRAELGWDQNLCFMNLLLPGLYCRKFIRRHFPDLSVSMELPFVIRYVHWFITTYNWFMKIWISLNHIVP